MVDWTTEVSCADHGARARQDVGHKARDAGVPADRLTDVALAASELLSNACQHGTDVYLEVGSSADLFEINVSNAAPSDAVPDPADWVMPSDPLAPRGRGLAIVKRVADEVGVRWRRGRLTVFARFRTQRRAAFT